MTAADGLGGSSAPGGRRAPGAPEPGVGDRLLGTLVDRSHETPPHLVAPLVAQEVTAVGGRDVSIHLQDYDQRQLLPLPGQGVLVGDPVLIGDSAAGRAFTSDAVVQEPVAGGVRLFLPMLDGSDRVGVLAVTVDAGDDGRVDEDVLRLARRLAGLVADLLVTKGLYTDLFFQARRSRPMTLSAEMQWRLLPPLTMSTPQVAVAGILEPAYDVGGDGFDYALNDDLLHLAVMDAMGHDLQAAVMSNLVVQAYRHARRADVGLPDLYAAMDAALRAVFSEDTFATAQMATLSVSTGLLSWVNAGHPAPLLIRGGRIAATLTGETTLPVGFGGAEPVVARAQLRPGDRVLFFTDGVVEERTDTGQEFGQDRFEELVVAAEAERVSVQETVRHLSHALMRARGGKTSDDATLLLVEWRTPDPGALSRLLPDPLG